MAVLPTAPGKGYWPQKPNTRTSFPFATKAAGCRHLQGQSHADGTKQFVRPPLRWWPVRTRAVAMLQIGWRGSLFQFGTEKPSTQLGDRALTWSIALSGILPPRPFSESN